MKSIVEIDCLSRQIGVEWRRHKVQVEFVVNEATEGKGSDKSISLDNTLFPADATEVSSRFSMRS